MTMGPKLLLAGGSALVLAGAGTAIAATARHGHASISASPAGRELISSRPGARGPGLRPGLGLRGTFGPRGRFFMHGGFPGMRGRLFMHGGFAGMRGGDDLAAAASYLGSTTSDLVAQLRAGKTLAQVADATSGKSAAGLIDALLAHEKQELADAVKAGRLTQAQADAISPTLQQRVTNLVNGVHAVLPGPGFGRHGVPGDLQAAASYLGVTTAALVDDLRSGKTLAQVANATSGKSAAGLIDALVAHEKQKLADAVKAGRLTQAQADAISATLQQRVTDVVNGVHRPFHGPPFAPHGLLHAAASYLGLTDAELVTQLQSGKTLAEIANATSGKSADGLVAALVAHAKEKLAGAVKAGKLTQAQADAMAAQLQRAFTELVNSPRLGSLHGRRGAPRI